MKLSEKGINKILNNSVSQTPNGESYLILDDLNKIEFDPDDFKGMVCLPIDEAKTIAHKLNDNSKFYYFQTENFDFETIELMDYLDDLIEGAEKKDD
jgi:hypothetical protein